jgi:cyanobactin maturation PatA/PatG family protease
MSEQSDTSINGPQREVTPQEADASIEEAEILEEEGTEGSEQAEVPSAALVPQGLSTLVPSQGVAPAGKRGPMLAIRRGGRSSGSLRGRVSPSCACATNGINPSESPAMVFSIGELSYDFGFEARLDYFIQRLGGKEANPVDPLKMAEHLRDNQEDANALIWTLNMDATPVYAIEPEDQFAVPTFLQLIRFMVEQEKEGVERISLAGHITGSTRLFNGSVVPTVAPVLRGMFNWNIEHLTQACFGEPPAEKEKEARAQYDEKSKGLRSFLERIYFQLRNLGTSAQDRAMNFAATNAFQSKEVFEDAVKEQMVLDAIGVERSPICRPDSDCWDVKLRFFDPAHRQERARKVYRYTVDVSDYVPVTVGRLRTWFEY